MRKTHTEERERERERESINLRMLLMMMTKMWLVILQYRDVLLSFLVGLVGFLLYFLISRWLRRIHRTQRMFEVQGVKFLPGSLLYGNLHEFIAIGRNARSLPMPELSHDIAPRIMPHLYQWSETYGELFAYRFGSQARFILTEPEQAKDILYNKFGHYKKPSGRPDTKDLGGNGLASLEGEKWAQHRRIVSPAFYLEKLKAMAPTMAACTDSMIKTWEERVEKGEAIDVSQEFRDLTADIIAHTAFGSSFAEGKVVFELQHKQQALFSKLNTSLYIPGSRFLPTAQNRYCKKINKRIVEVLTRIIERRMELYKGDNHDNDLLGLMMAANKGELQGNQKNLSMGIDELIDECKTFFFAGHETMSTLLTWMFLLLGSSPEWQERLREEVREVCGMTELPKSDSVHRLRLITMVINEALRLYPPAVAMFRKADTDMKVGKIVVPAGTIIVMPVIAWHHDKRYWGPDASEFRPVRFEEGISRACGVPGAYLPFSMGPRYCIGQMFAIIEAKMVLATILQRYRFHLSPEYIHAPTIILTIQPQFGMPMIFEKL